MIIFGIAFYKKEGFEMNRKIRRKLAKKHGVTPQEVERDMQAAIDFAYENPDRTLSQIKAQNAIPHKGNTPTTDEFICHIANKLK